MVCKAGCYIGGISNFDTKIFRLTESLKALDYLNLTEVFYGFIY